MRKVVFLRRSGDSSSSVECGIPFGGRNFLMEGKVCRLDSIAL